MTRERLGAPLLPRWAGALTISPPSRCHGAMGWNWRKSPKALTTAIINRVLLKLST